MMSMKAAGMPDRCRVDGAKHADRARRIGMDGYRRGARGKTGKRKYRRKAVFSC
jgi:hypothetical protein